MLLLKWGLSKWSRFTSKAIYKNKCPRVRPSGQSNEVQEPPCSVVALTTQSLGWGQSSGWPSREPSVPICWLGLCHSGKLRPPRVNTLWAASGCLSSSPGLPAHAGHWRGHTTLFGLLQKHRSRFSGSHKCDMAKVCFLCLVDQVKGHSGDYLRPQEEGLWGQELLTNLNCIPIEK